MSQHWRYTEPADEDGWITTHELSEDEIIRTFFRPWCELMVKAGKGHLISRQHCIDDWVTVHWAEPV